MGTGRRFSRNARHFVGALQLRSPDRLSPSPGTPGEGWGEGPLANARLGARREPSPCPLPAYREREDQGDTVAGAPAVVTIPAHARTVDPLDLVVRPTCEPRGVGRAR